MLGGGADDDVYIWQPGDGDDVISGEDSGMDVLWLGGQQAANLSALRAGDDYLLLLPSATIRIEGFYTGSNQIEAIQTEL